MKNNKNKNKVVTITVTIHEDDTQSVEVMDGTVNGSTGPMDTLWDDVESSVRGGLMNVGVIDSTGIGEWEK